MLYSSFEGLEYSDEVTSDEALDDVSLLALTPFLELFDAMEGFPWGPLVVGICPSSASLLRRFMIVGTNLEDKEIRPGSCLQLHNYKSTLLDCIAQTET